jgi:adenine-specific DNA-methyltransferase
MMKKGFSQGVDKFQQLLRELFQFDCADLDFGIYRIMNYKRDVIEKFITQDLPGAIAEELDRGILADQSQVASELQEVSQQIEETLGRDALDADGNLVKTYHGTPLGDKYVKLKAKAAGGRGREALETGIFNHLYALFSRYYQDGDFVSKRRYSRRQRYAIPYNGEEVYLYWANHDQYYVKTAEHFHDYTFTSHGVTVHFKLRAASVEQNNVKGDRRFFLPCPRETEWDGGSGQLVIPFEYRPLTDQEEITYGKKNRQDAIIAGALTEIPKRLSPKSAGQALAALMTEKRKNAEGGSISFLEHHLRQYTRRNTSDFFIHKDLKGYLCRELDFYLKNEVLNLDEMEAGGEDRAEGWFQVMRVIKSVGGRIIDFLDQIESFQKMLWEKRKFITETQYCITVGVIAEDFYPGIASCEPQWAEWRELFHIDEEETNLFNSGKNKRDKRIDFLRAHPTLVLDTGHFETDFIDRLLASFDDLDEMTDGLLIHSENFQALNLLRRRYSGGCDTVFADPPYNTGVDGFPYRDTYQHSSWLSMMENRLSIVKPVMSDTGLLFLTIDFIEVSKLRLLCDNIFGPENFLADIAWEKRYTRSNNAKRFYSLKDTVLSYRTTHVLDIIRESRSEKSKSNYSNPDNDPRGPWISSSYVNPATRAQRPNLVYPIRNPHTKKEVEHPTHAWKYDRETHMQHIAEDRLYWGLDGGYEFPRLKSFFSEASEGMVPIDVWHYKSTGTTDDGGNVLKEMFGSAVFDNPKPPSLVERALSLSPVGTDSLLTLDHFAGSGTTGHAVINLNREEGGNRKFILVEMGQYFDTVLLPRIKKVTFTPEWKEGKPRRMATPEEAGRSPRIVKYIRLESYEDALNNIEFDDTSGQKALAFEDYLLKYMLKWETKHSETLLNVEKLARPFSYKLHIHADGQTCQKVADIPGTFNYLLGLNVRTRRVYNDNGRRYLVYRGRIDHRQIAVIWRDTEGWQKADLERDKKFVAEGKLTEGADEVFVNGDSFIPDARALEPLFKARMFAPVEV